MMVYVQYNIGIHNHNHKDQTLNQCTIPLDFTNPIQLQTNLYNRVIWKKIKFLLWVQ